MSPHDEVWIDPNFAEKRKHPILSIEASLLVGESKQNTKCNILKYKKLCNLKMLSYPKSYPNYINYIKRKL
jgi:hypothetical protein